MEQLPDGTYQGTTEDGYCSAVYADIVQALEDATTHITTQKGEWSYAE